ncbi:BspA family leucine-rich repeat surface protein [Planktomarina temperata]|nr:BspA family leucine-rich repeat surface protein [Planktomarina temperata]
MKFCLFVLAFIALVPQAAWSACNLSATTPSEVDTGRKLVNADTAAITQAAIRNHDITGCDVSGITDMEGLFYFHPNTFNQDIGGWNVSNVTNMKHMFRNAYVFNQDISGWNTRSVTNMERMFTFSYEFNQDISNWNVSNVTNLFATFESARALNQDFTRWNVSNVTTFQGMFLNATAMLARGAPSTPDITFFGPTIASTSVNSANTELTVTFSESVYDTTGGTGDLEVADFALSIAGGVATLGSATPTSITKTSQSVWVLGFSTTGTPTALKP